MGVDAYLALYRSVGDPLQWDSRLRVDPVELATFLCDDTCAIFVLRESGAAVGICEFEGFGQTDVELTHFGLIPSAQGRGMGSYLLDECLRECWANRPRRVWLHTDTNDDPLAIAVYERAGFRCYKSEIETFPD